MKDAILHTHFTQAEAEAARKSRAPFEMEIDGRLYEGTAIVTGDDRVVCASGVHAFALQLTAQGAENVRAAMKAGGYV